MADPRHARIRAELEREGWDAIVLTNTHDVVYATGYSSIMEYWTLQEPICAAIVARDPSIPVTLVMPEANIALLAVAADSGQPDRAEELRLTELLTFCRMARAPDPDARPGPLHHKAMEIFGNRVRGKTRDNLVDGLTDALADHGLAKARVAFDDLRVWLWVQNDARFAGYKPLDGVDAMVRARSVKTPEEMEAVRRTGPKADAAIQFAAAQLQSGLNWSDLTLSVAGFMASQGITPVDEGTMLFGGAYDGEFIPELFRTRYDKPFQQGQIVILETLGKTEGFWIDINRTAVIGPPTAEYQALHDTVRDGYLGLLESLKPGFHTGALTAMGHDYMRAKGIAAPEKLLVFAHGVGMMPVESPVPGPSMGTRGAAGFTLEENMVVSVDCLFFGARIGPCHMENVFIIHADGAEPLYRTPLELMGPR
ncbi:MAG TPA: M24 family metallopeptidase [Steroidobacteraceae bacterium]|nr:M24 family metallopeptidase [Steroidobacteraceae bacterium]